MILWIPIRTRHPLRLTVIVLLLDAILLVARRLHQGHFGATASESSFLAMVVLALRGLLVFSFLLIARRELWLLFTRPTTTLGTGMSRVWAVARTTILEAWASRIWLLPVIWLVCALILICAVVPFDESERIPLYIRTLLTSQQVLVLVMMWVMACVSLPREREKKTLISTSSKPLSRLEILLGKFTGFAAATGLMLGFMFVASLVILGISDWRLRGRAAEAYEIQRRDFNKTLLTPSEELKQLSLEGSLFAYNYITVPKTGMNVGVLAFDRTNKAAPPIRYLMGGTNEKAVFHFTPQLEVPHPVMTASPGGRPFFVFVFPLAITTPIPPAKIEIRVTAYASGPATPMEATLTLNNSGLAYWEPDQPDLLFSMFDAGTQRLMTNRGPVTVEVTCLTPGVYLEMMEGADRDPVTGQVPAGTVANIEFSARLDSVYQGMPPQIVLPNAHPVVRGFERRDRQEVAGHKAGQQDIEQAIYRFPGSSLRNVPIVDGQFELSMQFETYKSEEPDQPTFAGIKIHSLDNTGVEDFEILRQEVLEKRVMTVKVPASSLGDKDPNRRGDMIVMVYCATPGHSVTLIEDSVRIELPRTPFFVNYFKSELIIYVEALLLIAIAITCSVRLGWPVAMFLSAVCVAYGLLVDYIASLPDYGGLGALNYRPSSPDALYNFFDNAASMLWHVLGFISSIVPDFTIFNPETYIGTLQNTPWSVVWGDAFNATTFAIPFLAISYLLFRKQELG